MITSAKEYLARLQEIRNENLHTETLYIPSDELVYAVDLDARTIDTPVFLSTETDHVAETVFFCVDRYFETYDLAESTCVIQYINAKNEPYIYVVPVYDLESYAEYGKMLIPWVIQGHATEAAGTIKYAIRFYRLHKIERPEGTIGDEYEFDYIINTQVAQSKILKGMGATFLENAPNPLAEIAAPSEWEELFSELREIIDDPTHQLKLYWTILD